MGMNSVKLMDESVGLKPHQIFNLVQNNCVCGLFASLSCSGF